MTNLLQDAVFWSSLAVVVMSGYKYTVNYCLKSKCEQFNCLWGLLKIKRDIRSEVEIERMEKESTDETDIDLELGEKRTMERPATSPQD